MSEEKNAKVRPGKTKVRAAYKALTTMQAPRAGRADGVDVRTQPNGAFGLGDDLPVIGPREGAQTKGNQAGENRVRENSTRRSQMKKSSKGGAGQPSEKPSKKEPGVWPWIYHGGARE